MCKYCDSVDLYNGVDIINPDELSSKVVLIASDDSYILRMITPDGESDSDPLRRCPMCGRPFRPRTYEYKDVFEYVDTLKNDPEVISAALTEMKEMQKDTVLSSNNIAENNRVIKALQNRITARLAPAGPLDPTDVTDCELPENMGEPVVKDTQAVKDNEEIEVVHPTPEEIGQVEFDGTSVEMNETEILSEPTFTEEEIAKAMEDPNVK